MYGHNNIRGFIYFSCNRLLLLFQRKKDLLKEFYNFSTSNFTRIEVILFICY